MTYACFMNTHPTHTREASKYTKNSLVFSGKVYTRAVSLPFNNWRLSSQDSDHSNLNFLGLRWLIVKP